MSTRLPTGKIGALRNAPLSMGRMASAWWAISRALSDGGEVALLEALAGVAGSLAARLYGPDGAAGDGSAYSLKAHWCWAEMPDEPGALNLAFDPADEGLVLLGEGAADVPLANPSPFALLPLPYRGKLSGVVVFACPVLPAVDALAREALLLAARQAGCHLAARAAATALAETASFGDFHRAIAFAMHDIKGLSGQLSLLARNAGQHGDNPAFRADMVLTLRSASTRLDALLASLSQGAQGAADQGSTQESVDIGTIAQIIAEAQTGHSVTVIEREPCAITGAREVIEQILTHLVQNAIEASPADAPVFIGISADGPWARIEIIDSGHGMSPDFLRDRLFRPFDTPKPGGFGIGAYEARERVRAMGGRLEVESREGVGTRFIIRLPRAVSLHGRATA